MNLKTLLEQLAEYAERVPDDRLNAEHIDRDALIAGAKAALAAMGKPAYFITVTGRLHETEPTVLAFDLPDGRHALYTAPPQPVVECNDSDSPWLVCKTCAAAGKCAKADSWRKAVEHELAMFELSATDDPRESIKRLIDWNCAAQIDPDVSSAARELIERGGRHQEALLREVEFLREELAVWQRRFDTLLQQIASIDAMRPRTVTMQLPEGAELPVKYRLSPTDIYDFAGWLTTRPGTLVVGSSHDAAPMAEAVCDYIKTYPQRFE